MRPAWLERFRVHNIFRGKKNKKAVYIDNSSKVVQATHFSLAGGAYSIPSNMEEFFSENYVYFVFGEKQGQLALTEKELVSQNGCAYTSCFIDLDLRYPLESDGLWTFAQVERALSTLCRAIWKHVDVDSLGTHQRI